MTVSTTYAPVQYTGNGVTTVFAFPYKFFETTNLIVYLDGVVQSTGFTITGGMGEDGDVTFSVAPANGVVVTIELSLPYTQLDDYVENQAFPADTLEQALDKAAIRDQQLNDAVTRSLRYPPTISGITNATLPTPVSGSALLFDGTDGKIVASANYIEEAITAATSGVTGLALLTATSPTSLPTTGTGNKTWVIQSGRGFAMGQRLRAASDDGTKINEGVVTSYSGTSLVINVDYVSGTGTHADWNISVIGDRGASGGGTGDMLASQNLNDVASKPAAFNTIKQAATDSNSGVVELATNAETIAGTDTTRATTPANIKAYVDATCKLNSFVRVGTSNGAGSTNINIRRFTTTIDSAGSDITYADSATLGGTFTINTTGVYSISYTDSFSAAAGMAITRNASTLNASYVGLPATQQLIETATPFANFRNNCSVTVPLTAGDVIRAHLDANNANGTSPAQTRFVITRIS